VVLREWGTSTPPARSTIFAARSAAQEQIVLSGGMRELVAH
jgi:hypothetical protein